MAAIYDDVDALVGAFASGERSAIDIAEGALRSIEKRDTELHAFLTRDALVASEASRPITAFRSFVTSLDVGPTATSDALLIPR